MNLSHKHHKNIFPAKETFIVSKTFFDEVKKSTGYIELSKDKIETSRHIYEVKK